MQMQFFLDTADLVEIVEINEALKTGQLAGVTTNPTHAAKQKIRMSELYREICRLVSGPVSLEVDADKNTPAEEMLRQARILRRFGENVVVKIPAFHPAGYRAMDLLRQENIPVNATLVFNVDQALLSAYHGAAYVSPFVGRLDDAGKDGMDVVKNILRVFRGVNVQDTKVLVASVRSLDHVIEAIRIGAEVITLPHGIFQQVTAIGLPDINDPLQAHEIFNLINWSPHQLTPRLARQGIERFRKDWESIPAEYRDIF